MTHFPVKDDVAQNAAQEDEQAENAMLRGAKTGKVRKMKVLRPKFQFWLPELEAIVDDATSVSMQVCRIAKDANSIKANEVLMEVVLYRHWGAAHVYKLFMYAGVTYRGFIYTTNTQACLMDTQQSFANVKQTPPKQLQLQADAFEPPKDTQLDAWCVTRQVKLTSADMAVEESEGCMDFRRMLDTPSLFEAEELMEMATANLIYNMYCVDTNMPPGNEGDEEGRP